jgi:predicted dienelactone hydrolase
MRADTQRTPRTIAAALVAAALLAAACGDDDSSGTASETTTPADATSTEAPSTTEAPTTTEAPLDGDARYAERGPYDVGVTTLDLPDRQVEVYYPAAEGSTTGEPKERYVQTGAIPEDILASLPPVPDGVDLSVEIDAYRDVAVAGDGPFPLVLFSHGAGGWRAVYGNPLSGLASWGFVVASTDYIEYGLVAMFAGGGQQEDRYRSAGDAAMATIDLLDAEHEADGGLLAGAVDTSAIGAVGHSAGGGLMFTLLDDPRIAAVVGWAPVPPQAASTIGTPTMIVAAADDIAITPEDAEASFDSLDPPKRLVVIEDAGHNAYSDACVAIRDGTDLFGLAQEIGIPVPEQLRELSINGCEEGDLATEKGWAIIQHATVAALRDALGIDDEPVGLGPGLDRAVPGVRLTYDEEL